MSFFVETEHAVQLRFIDSTTNEMGTYVSEQLLNSVIDPIA